MRILECVQGTDEWFEARRGILTSSNAAACITAAKGAYPAAARTMQCELARDLIRGFSDDEAAKFAGMDGPFSAAMAHGVQTEPQARAAYQLSTGNKVRKVGVVLNLGAGASTDALVGDDGVLEIKCPDPKTHIRYLDDGVLPQDYRPQVHMEMAVCERRWVDFYSFCEDWPEFLIRVEWDDYTDKLVENLARFNREYTELLERLADKGCQIPECDAVTFARAA